MNKNIRVIKVSNAKSTKIRIQSQQARIIFDPPNKESVLVVYWCGSKRGLFDAIVEYILPDNCFKCKCNVRHDYIDGLLKPLSADTPLPKEWYDKNSEQIEIIKYRGAKPLNNLKYILRW